MSDHSVVKFLLARIAEDEEVARAANGPRWESGGGDVSEGGLYALEGEDEDGWSIAWFELGTANESTDGSRQLPRWRKMKRRAHDNSVHAARHDPAHVLAECQAKRKVIEFHKSWPVLVDQPPQMDVVEPARVDEITYRVSQKFAWMTTQEYIDRFGIEPPTTPILAALAAVYADHPDYKEEWRA